MTAQTIVQVAVFKPLRKTFEYLNRPGGRQPSPGSRVLVPIGRSSATGIVMGLADESRWPRNKLKPISDILDSEPLLPADTLALLAWAATYYHHPLGEVVSAALPVPLRRGNDGQRQTPKRWVARPDVDLDDPALKKATRQRAMLAFIAARPEGVGREALQAEHRDWRKAVTALVDKGFVEVRSLAPPTVTPVAITATELNSGQQQAVQAMVADLDGFNVSLLQGVTGSGKTEVYFALIKEVLAQGRQVLVLVPEINLTPQLLQRFEARFGCRPAVLHSGLGDGEKTEHWHQVRLGEARILVGTRLAVFTPFADLGLIVVDEEHDLSYKQQEGFRYHARDVAVRRAQMQQLPVVLGSATPSLESLHNAREGRYRHLHLPRRAGEGRPPAVTLVDMRPLSSREVLSPTLIEALKETVAQGNQALLFLNRRGYAPVLLCHHCAWVARCQRCDMPFTWHAVDHRLRCHHCGVESPPPRECPDCHEQDFLPLGTGTQKLEDEVRALFPGVSVARIDRDNTRRKGALDAALADVAEGRVQILVGTQMLAKGHDFHDLTLVGVLNGDQGLFSSDFRASERMVQLLTQVAGRAGRGAKAGQVLVQTHQPDHPLLTQWLQQGFDACAVSLLGERRAIGLPPYGFQVLVRARAATGPVVTAFLREIMGLACALEPGLAREVMLLGPVPAPMERRGGEYRYQLLLQARQRGPLHRFLKLWLPQVEALKSARKVRWSVDVDPMEMY